MKRSTLAHWPGLRLLHRIAEGNRNEVWRAEIGEVPVAVRQSRRSQASLDWELDLIERLDEFNFCVPTVIAAADGARHVDGVVVQRWIEGTPPDSEDEWRSVAQELMRLHREMSGFVQRPDCCTVLELSEQAHSVDADLDAIPSAIRLQLCEVFATFGEIGTSLIHGDPAPSNLRITPDGRVGLLDWDESRVDLVWHDLSELGVQVLNDTEHEQAGRLSNAWEAANAWTAEPDYARQRLDALVDS